ncbi:MAG TPA: class I SAM-dependent methyltransferase [Terriglobia bacterium]|nr:class I SAM-dependent methyltransferase [Terriglobia bacterium]
MRVDWNERARDNAFHYICSERKDWDPASFFDSGEDDYARLVSPLLVKLNFTTEGKSMLEVGCGVGRVTRSFARRFGAVTALDISEEMLGQARQLNGDIHNIVWIHGDGMSLKGVPSESVDLVFSYLVLQHVPNKAVALGYVAEMLRVLRPAGVYCFQFNGAANPSMNWKGRLIWNLIDRLADSPQDSWMKGGAKRLAAILGLDGLAAGHTWRGAALDPGDIVEAVRRSGGLEPYITGRATSRTWCYGHKEGVE